MKKIITLAILLSCVVYSNAQSTITGNIIHDGKIRDYRLFIPSTYQAGTPLPLVFNLHGAGSNAVEQEFYCQMNKIADTASFFVCYPNGINNFWNVGWSAGSNADDVGFLNALIDSLQVNYTINPSRIYSCGMSNGGFMSYQLACASGDRFAAIASVTGSMTPTNYANCQPTRPFPVFEIHGTADLVVPFEGLANVSISIDSVIDFWTAENGCSNDPDINEIPDINTLDGCTATRYDYLNCLDNTKVSLIKVEGGGHTWPGALLTVGVTNRDFSASEEIWLFFRQYETPNISNLNQDIVFSSISLYPNPTTNQLFLENAQLLKGTLYRITNLMGKTVQSGLIDELPIDVSKQNPGMYHLHAIKDNTLFSKAFIKY